MKIFFAIIGLGNIAIFLIGLYVWVRFRFACRKNDLSDDYDVATMELMSYGDPKSDYEKLAKKIGDSF